MLKIVVWYFAFFFLTYLVHVHALAMEKPFPNDVLSMLVAELCVGVRHRKVEFVKVKVAKVHRDEAEDDSEHLEADANIVGVLPKSSQVMAVAERNQLIGRG